MNAFVDPFLPRNTMPAIHLLLLTTDLPQAVSPDITLVDEDATESDGTDERSIQAAGL